MPRRTTSAPKRFVTPRTSSASSADAGAGGVGSRGLGAHASLERAMSRSNCAFSAIAKMITTPTQT